MALVLRHAKLVDGKIVPARKHKYGAKRATLDGYSFDSQAEKNRYASLALAQRAGQISELKVHPRYPLRVNEQHIAAYEADFSFYEPHPKSGRRFVVLDIKGVHTEAFKIKAKLFCALYPHADFRVEQV